MQRIGVFVCHCGTNIASTVDVKRSQKHWEKNRLLYLQPITHICVLRQDKT